MNTTTSASTVSARAPIVPSRARFARALLREPTLEAMPASVEPRDNLLDHTFELPELIPCGRPQCDFVKTQVPVHP